jgi:ribosomal protein S18 acetylase RimI-like enzyme
VVGTGGRGSSYCLGMERPSNLRVGLLELGEVDAYLDLTVAVDADSGVDGAAHSHPYGRDEPLDVDAARDREVTRWSTGIDEVGWRRAWGLRDGSSLAGYVYLAGGALPSELHRVELGMGVLASHRRRGGGSMLLATAIQWAEQQPAVAWIDLGVFSDNPAAQALYARHGFVVLGRTPDRFRVDGHSLVDISMTLAVG